MRCIRFLGRVVQLLMLLTMCSENMVQLVLPKRTKGEYWVRLDVDIEAQQPEEEDFDYEGAPM